MLEQKGMTDLFVRHVERMSSMKKQIIWSFADLLAIALGLIASNILFYQIVHLEVAYFMVYLLVAFTSYLILSHVTHLSARLNRYSGLTDFVQLFLVMIVACLIATIATYVIGLGKSWRVSLLSMNMAASLVVLWRIIWQWLYATRYRGKTKNDLKNVILVGAGDGGSMFMRNYNNHPSNLNIIGILDSDPKKHGKVIGGVKVLGDIDRIPDITHNQNVEEIIVAIPSIEPQQYERILNIANPLKIKVFKMPLVEAVIQGNFKPLKQSNKVNIADLLGRKEVVLDEERLRKELESKVVLITGAGGSIGSEIARQVSKFGPKRVILLGHGENSIYLIYHELKKLSNMVEYVPVIADIQDYDRVLEVLEREHPDVLYHAAAHKHVPLMEYNPVEAFKNNILGTYNVAKAVDSVGIPKMVMVSTDKAINPPNVMGATKRVAELIITGFDQQSQSNYSAVRFGNVLGSRGSVIPVFEKQIEEGGPVTVTDFRMTRYFMTIPEASRLVLYSGAFAKGGEVFVLDMGEPVKIVDLAKKLILLSGYHENDIEIVESGIRPGEKLFEEILTSGEAVTEQIEKDIFIGKVATMPLEKIDTFIQSLYDLPAEKLKQRIIAFANNSIQETTTTEETYARRN